MSFHKFSAITVSLLLTAAVAHAAPPKAAVKAKPKAAPAATPAKAAPLPEKVEVVSEDGSAAPVATAPADGQFKIRGDAPAAADVPQAPMKFKVYDEGAPAQASDAPADDVPFRAYIGYPKQQAGVFVLPRSLASRWTYNGQDFNFTSTAAAFGLYYRYIPNPTFSLEGEVNHDSASVGSATVGAPPIIIASSSVSYTSFNVHGDYCNVSNVSYFQQYCTGFLLGDDVYPILKFTTNTSNVAMGTVKDVVLGVRLSFQTPFTDNIIFKTTIGYNIGTGVGNSGVLTSKTNSSYYLKAMTDWNYTANRTLGLGLDYMVRNADLEGKIGNNPIKWETLSTTLGIRLAATATF